MKFKNIISSFAIVAALFAASIPAHAGIEVAAVLNGANGSNCVVSAGTPAAPITSNYVAQAVFSPVNSTYCTIDATAARMGTGTGVAVVGIDSSSDYVNWKTNQYILLLTGNGTTPVNNSTNILVGGFPFLRIGSIVNSNNTALTNITIKASHKTGL